MRYYLDEERIPLSKRDFTNVKIFLGAILMLAIVIVSMWCEGTEVRAQEPHEEYFVICDVESYDAETGTINVIMQTGDIEVYHAEDLPLEFAEVCLRTTDLDNFKKYEIVAIR